MLEEAVLVIASGLHYPDLVRLSRTSKSIRELVFPHGDLKIRKEKLRQATCQGSIPMSTNCWNCNIKICRVRRGGPCSSRKFDFINTFQDCSTSPNTANRLSCPIEYHLRTCNPHCTRCFYKRVGRNVMPNKHKPCPCKKSFHTHGGKSAVCKNCMQFDPNTQYRDNIRTITRTTEIKKQAAEVKYCFGCKTTLRRNRVWWICVHGHCNRECRNEVHMIKSRVEKE
jgi:hypothetical protein